MKTVGIKTSLHAKLGNDGLVVETENGKVVRWCLNDGGFSWTTRDVRSVQSLYASGMWVRVGIHDAFQDQGKSSVGSVGIMRDEEGWWFAYDLKTFKQLTRSYRSKMAVWEELEEGSEER